MLTWLRLLLRIGVSFLAAACTADGVGRPGAAGFDLAEAVSNFPDSVRHWSGQMAGRDPVRLLLHFKAPTNRNAMERRLAATDLELEPDLPNRQVLHTDAEYWVRNRNGGPFTSQGLDEANRDMGADLGWVGAVFRLPETTEATTPSDSLIRLYSSLPDRLILDFAPGYKDSARRKEAEIRLAGHQLKVDSWPDTGQNAIAHWIGKPEGNVYRLADSLKAVESDMILNVYFESGPMLSPAR